MMNKEKLFRYFGANLEESRTIRQISIDLGIPYMTLNRLMKDMEKRGLVTTKKVGKSIACSLNKGNEITKQHMIIASESAKSDLAGKKPIIRRICEAIEERKSGEFSAVLFGSYAAGNEQKHSDIDIAFISNKKSAIKNIENELKSIEQIHGIEINTMIFTEKQFIGMLAAKEENVGKQILKNHVILHNSEMFWNIIYGVKNGI
jgi:predicted nucleotidyltransferase